MQFDKVQHLIGGIGTIAVWLLQYSAGRYVCVVGSHIHDYWSAHQQTILTGILKGIWCWQYLLEWWLTYFSIDTSGSTSWWPQYVEPGTGVVHTNVGHQVMLITLYKGYLCTKFYIRWSHDITRQSTTTQITNKHHHHGDGAACPSSGVDSMNPHRLSGGRPCSCLFQGWCRRVLVESIN